MIRARGNYYDHQLMNWLDEHRGPARTGQAEDSPYTDPSEFYEEWLGTPTVCNTPIQRHGAWNTWAIRGVSAKMGAREVMVHLGIDFQSLPELEAWNKPTSSVTADERRPGRIPNVGQSSVYQEEPGALGRAASARMDAERERTARVPEMVLYLDAQRLDGRFAEPVNAQGPPVESVETTFTFTRAAEPGEFSAFVESLRKVGLEAYLKLADDVFDALKRATSEWPKLPIGGVDHAIWLIRDAESQILMVRAEWYDFDRKFGWVVRESFRRRFEAGPNIRDLARRVDAATAPKDLVTALTTAADILDSTTPKENGGPR